MAQRVSLLGGTFDIDSAPGGPTVISVTLPAWRPDEHADTAPEPRGAEAVAS
jgi:hypothetical protein